jgi:hypothetical protein
MAAMLVKSQKFEIFQVDNRNITSLTIISEKRRIPMKKTTIFFVFLLFVSANAILVWFTHAAESKDHMQPPITLSAKDFLPQDLLQGENYKVEEEVKSDGLINTYQLSTNYGPLAVESTAELLIRINELRALAIMEEMDRKKVFGDALVSGVKGTVKGATEFVKSPIESSKNIFKGTGQFISNLGESIFSDDPDQDNVVKVALGYDVAKRQFAFEFGIDPYTDYDPVVDRLGEIARAAVAGGLTPRAAMAAIDHTVVLAMRISGTAYGMMQLVRDNPPAKLKEINRGKLQKMDIDETLIEAFLDNYRYNPQEETLLVGELETMTGVKGVDVFIGRSALATEETMALSFRIRAQMMAGYHANVEPAQSIRNIEGVLSLQLKNGVLVILVPADFVAWTKKLEDKVNAFENSIGKMHDIAGKELWITGKFDKTALANFENKGWKVKENANAILLKRD